MLESPSPVPFLEPDPRPALPDWARSASPSTALSPFGTPPEPPAPEGAALPWYEQPERDVRGGSGEASDSSRDPLTGEPFDRLQVLPEAGRRIYRKAFALAERQIRIEICVLEDPKILAGLRDALDRGVRVRAIVDRGKYEALEPERQNLAAEFVAAGGELHLSNPIFPRSFPKTILIDSKLLVYGSACLDSTTFAQYRDFALSSTDPTVLRTIRRLFANDWAYSAPVGQEPPAFNPTPPVEPPELLIAPRNAAAGLSDLYQKAERRLDVYTEELGNAALESELVAAVARGVIVRLITPVQVNGASEEQNRQHTASIQALSAVGVRVRTSGPLESFDAPYMHARAARVDGRFAYVGSISLSADSTTVNREMGLIEGDPTVVEQLGRQFVHDFRRLTPVV
ncbi:MAG: phospholipase D-like domain-containing protein [Prochlorococcaceae cyanobacterium]|jgi:cardiolipin synthase